MKENLQAILELFANTLAADETVTSYRAARVEYFKDKELIKDLAEYEAIRTAYDAENAKEDKDTEALSRIGARAGELYDAITTNPLHEKMSEAEDALNALLNEVNGEIMKAITGEEGCSGDCGACHGHCH